MPVSHRIALLAAAGLLAVTAQPAPVASASTARVHDSQATVSRSSVVIGHSVRGRAIRAYQVGDPRAARTVVVIGQMHGNEKAGVTVANTLRTGATVKGIRLWVIPTMNPDGYVANTRRNAHDIDLNRNWPYSFVVDGAKGTGRRAMSEPENRAVQAFLVAQKASLVVVLHQPYGAVDAYDRRTWALRDAISRNMGIPIGGVDCPGGCHGTMMQWVHHTSSGMVGITVEFSRYPSHAYLVGRATRGLVASIGGHY